MKMESKTNCWSPVSSLRKLVTKKNKVSSISPEDHFMLEYTKGMHELQEQIDMEDNVEVRTICKQMMEWTTRQTEVIKSKRKPTTWSCTSFGRLLMKKNKVCPHSGEHDEVDCEEELHKLQMYIEMEDNFQIRYICREMKCRFMWAITEIHVMKSEIMKRKGSSHVEHKTNICVDKPRRSLFVT